MTDILLTFARTNAYQHMISYHLSELYAAIRAVSPDRVFVLTDVNTQSLCLPRLRAIGIDAPAIAIGASDEAKTLDSLAQVWSALSDGGATRHSLLINLGGGMVTDLGGFAASTFKRGISYINIPTTLLSMVDASVGGKTGINFHGLKNEIGVFSDSRAVIIDTLFLRTLNQRELCSGFAEMLKLGLISTDAHLAELLRFDIVGLNHVQMGTTGGPDIDDCSADETGHFDARPYDELSRLVAESVAVKERIVTEDPREQGLRKALNLGHTIGHAFESLALSTGTPIPHGYAVAWGLVCELYMSVVQCGFPQDKFRKNAHFIVETYGRFAFNCKQYDHLYELMTHDKKNTAGVINFTLLSDVGVLRLNQTATKDAIFEALDFLREG